MKIAISTMGQTVDSEVDSRFGRCRYFVIVDLETMQSRALDNSAATGSGGVGVSTTQTIIKEGVEAIITGNCGPNAHQALTAAGIKIITGITGNVQDVIEDYRSGKLKTSSQPNVGTHTGMNPGKITD
ncbi:MAG TPA: dinitrogenase iron-molybdenum cofactor biosynthesis protein [Dehalococcoidia bacterium]|nr:dinitrogenase iron-molybdenum cofactor biosynthesis protein [Dehalococcoidia bacterium]